MVPLRLDINPKTGRIITLKHKVIPHRRPPGTGLALVLAPVVVWLFSSFVLLVLVSQRETTRNQGRYTHSVSRLVSSLKPSSFPHALPERCHPRPVSYAVQGATRTSRVNPPGYPEPSKRMGMNNSPLRTRSTLRQACWRTYSRELSRGSPGTSRIRQVRAACRDRIGALP